LSAWRRACNMAGAMRRALIVLLALPTSVLAQTINKDSNTIDVAQCKGVSNTDPPLSDDMSLGLTWTVAAVESSTIATDDVFRLYAANAQPAAGQTTTGSTVGSSCTTNTSGASINANQVGSDIAATSTTVTATQTFSMAEIASKAGYNCTDTASVTVYLCVQWLGASSNVKGYATTTITLDRTFPPAPTNGTPSPGDGSLHLSCSGGSGSPSATAFVGKATSVADPTDIKYSSQASICSDVVVNGLTNKQEYSVVVYGVSASNNPSPASAAVSGTPLPTDDFYSHYKNDGGRETGGCSTAAGAAGMLSALGLLALRRRKP
jgi:hypothetical protein